MAFIWHWMNAIWYHIFCDVFSGLFAITPNLSEIYKVLNSDHSLVIHHPERIVMDVVYWFELYIETPLALNILNCQT